MEKMAAPVVQPRRDFPPVTPTTRGCIGKAMAAATSERAPEALAEIEDLKFSNSSKNSRSAQWKTWATLAEAWSLPPLPLSVDLVNKMAASFRAGGYRSTSNYFARAKEQHLQCIGEPVSPRTACAIKQAIRAADRGSLSSQLKESFELELFASSANQTGETNYDTTAEYIRSTEFAVNFTVLGSWWMTREIELAAAKIVDVEQTSQAALRWKLPASEKRHGRKGPVEIPRLLLFSRQTGSWEPLLLRQQNLPVPRDDPAHQAVRPHDRIHAPLPESTRTAPLET